MSRSPDALRPRPTSSSGFTLIEVVVATAMLALVMLLVAPQVIIGLRSTGISRDVTQSKGVAQAKIEEIRNLPFYVGRAAGDYLDVLDTYYRNTAAPSVTPACASTLTALPPVSWTGYVSTSGTRCPWEPAAGPFYRKVINPVAAPGLGVFAMSVSTQFLSGSTPPAAVAPLPGYDSQTGIKDVPPASQVGVTVSVFYRSSGKVRHVTTYTQVERGSPVTPLIDVAAKATTLSVSSAAENGTGMAANVGVLNLVGEVFTGSRTVTTAAGTVGTTTLGEQASGALLNLVAPTDKTTTGTSGIPGQLSNGCEWVCFGSTRVRDASALSSSGLPRAGTPTAPIRVEIPNGTTRNGFQFANGSTGSRLRLAAGQPMVSIDTSETGTMEGVRNCDITNVSVPTEQVYLAGTGYLHTSAGATPGVHACATAQANTIQLFPTSFAPKGVVRITLTKAEAQCSVSLSGGTRVPAARAKFEATVRYMTASGYVTAGTISSGNTTDPLAAVPLDTSVGVGGLTLGDYISSWRSLTTNRVVQTAAGRTARVDLQGVVNIITQPTREGILSGVGVLLQDPTSAISLNIGTLSCQAGDHR